MLNFGMETKRINEIVNQGARTRLTDKEFLEREINKFLASPARKWMIDGDRYYDYEHDVNQRKRMVIGENGELAEDKTLPCHKFIDNQYAEMVDQKTNYLFSKPITVDTKNDIYEKSLSEIFNKRFHKLLKNVGKDSYNAGIAWLYVYYDDKGDFRIKRFAPSQILPFWKNAEEEELEFVVRIYDVDAYEGQKELVIQYVEVYDEKGIYRFKLENGKLIPDYQTYYFEHENLEYNWKKIPFIPFRANSRKIPLIKRCKGLQDGLNELLSAFADGMEENASGNTIIVIKNYDGEDLGTFRRNLSQYKAVKVRTIEGTNGGIDKLEIEVNVENYKVILAELRKAIITNCRGYDIQELKSSGSPNEMSIKAVYSNLDLDANEIETEYQASFEELLWFVNMHLAQAGKGDFSNEEISIIFNRDMMVNESQIIADINSSINLLSRKTCISMHPYIDDVDGELEQIEKEKTEDIEQYSQAFINHPAGGDVIEE